MASSDDASGIRIVLEPEDEFNHEPDPVPNYNESMYFNVFDPQQLVGGWFRMGNRVNEGYAEMSVCLYLPDGRVGFMFGRPKIDTNEVFNAGGMSIEVVTPFEALKVNYEGKVLLLDEPWQMANPKKAFTENPQVPAKVSLDYRGVAPMYGGRPVNADGSDIVTAAEKSFAKAHYEQHVAATGTIEVGDETFQISGFGLRDKSWGPRYWQAISWYRWLPMNFGEDFAMMLSVIDRGGREPRQSGMVLENGEYHEIREVSLDTVWDERWHQTSMTAVAKTDHRTYEITGEVMSLIPLRNRRETPEGEMLHTRITEGMTRFECDGKVGYGLSEYLDQIVDGAPVGSDVINR
jgi:hypothetical protein